MKTSRKSFIIIFLILAFAFQFVSNSILGPEIRLFPADGEWFPGQDSPVSWKNKLAAILYPVKYILIKPLSFLGQDPDPAPPILVLAFALYWTIIALVLHFLLTLLFNRKNS